MAANEESQTAAQLSYATPNCVDGWTSKLAPADHLLLYPKLIIGHNLKRSLPKKNRCSHSNLRPPTGTRRALGSKESTDNQSKPRHVPRRLTPVRSGGLVGAVLTPFVWIPRRCDILPTTRNGPALPGPDPTNHRDWSCLRPVP